MFKYILFLICAFYLGWKSREWYARRIINSIVKQANLGSKNADGWVKVKLEKYWNIFYLYEESGAFIGQGTTWKEIEDILRKKYPNSDVKVCANNIDKNEFQNETGNVS